MDTISYKITTQIPINLGLIRPYYFVSSPYNQKIWDRVFQLESGNICQVIVTHTKALSTELTVDVISTESLTQRNKAEINKRLDFELGIRETFTDLKPIIQRDQVFARAVFSIPGFRLYANSNFMELLVLVLLSQNSDPIEYRQKQYKLLSEYGHPLPWNDRRFLFPTEDELIQIDLNVWKQYFSTTRFEYVGEVFNHLREIEIYTYYPDWERGFKNLVDIPGIGHYTAKSLLIYGARVYSRPFVDSYITDVLRDLYLLSDRLGEKELENWLSENFKDQAALVSQVLMTYKYPMYLRRMQREISFFT